MELEARRADDLEKRVDKLEIKHEELKKDFNDHRNEFIETKTYVKLIYTDVSAIKNSIEKDKSKNNSKWEQFWSKASWLLIAVLISIILVEVGLK